MAGTAIPQQLMTGALLHFEQGVPISDLDIRREHKDRLARVQHVYWQWVRNPMLDVFPMFKQLVKGKGADVHTEWSMARKDKMLFDFVVEHVAPPSRRVDEMKVRAAADKMMKIGMETDNVNALDKGSKRLMEVAQLDKPEEERIDMSKMAFLPPVVTTSVKDADDTKEDVDDQEMKRIMSKYGGYVDEKEVRIEKMVEVMVARGKSLSPDPSPEGEGSSQSEQSEYSE